MGNNHAANAPQPGLVPKVGFYTRYLPWGYRAQVLLAVQHAEIRLGRPVYGVEVT